MHFFFFFFFFFNKTEDLPLLLFLKEKNPQMTYWNKVKIPGVLCDWFVHGVTCLVVRVMSGSNFRATTIPWKQLQPCAISR